MQHVCKKAIITPPESRFKHLHNQGITGSTKWFLLLLATLFASTTAFGQKVVKGTVVDDLSIPVAGANVVLKDAAGVGTITDFDGNFQLEVPS